MSSTRGKYELTAELEDYHERIAARHLAPLWERLGTLLTREPRVASKPQLWHYDGLRDLLLESADLISAEEAERRVLILENAGLPGSSAIVEGLFAGLQLVMPGEIAPSHRHSPAALRFILEGDGAYTSVDGERLPMHVGDFIVTPSWRWHDHGHEGSGPFVWLDILDLPTVRNACAIFFEEYPDYRYPESRPSQDSFYRFGVNMRPSEYKRTNSAPPLLCFPYEQTRTALERLKRHSDWDPCHALKMEFVDPTTGGPAIPTISTYIQLLPAGFETERYRTTAGTVFCVVSGSGTLRLTENETRQISFGPNDIFVVPCWQPYQFVVDEETVLFSASDCAAQMRLGLWRELRGG